MTHRADAVEYLRKDGGTFGMIGIPKRDRESDVSLKPQGRRFEWVNNRLYEELIGSPFIYLSLYGSKCRWNTRKIQTITI